MFFKKATQKADEIITQIYLSKNIPNTSFKFN